MDKGPRKASDVLLELENSVANLTGLLQNQDMLLKVISNKLSELLSKPSIGPAPVNLPKVTVEAVNTQSLDLEKNILVSPEDTLPQETSPSGFRRTSRPETFSGDNSYLNKAPPMKEKEIKYPTQIPRPSGGAEVIVPEAVTQSKKTEPVAKKQNTGAAVPIKQRIVDASGKSVFLADVEIFNAESGESASKTRTNGTGKWMASLPLGNYKVVVRKRDSLSKDTKEVVQNIQIDGSINQVELPVMIIK